jgi:hypothetical protein
MASQVQNAAEALEDAGGWEPSDPQDVHDTIQAIPRIPRGAQELLRRVASQLEEHPNVDPATSEAIHEAASQLSAISDQLEQKLSAGVMPG